MLLFYKPDEMCHIEIIKSRYSTRVSSGYSIFLLGQLKINKIVNS